MGGIDYRLLDNIWSIWTSSLEDLHHFTAHFKWARAFHSNQIWNLWTINYFSGHYRLEGPSLSWAEQVRHQGLLQTHGQTFCYSRTASTPGTPLGASSNHNFCALLAFALSQQIGTRPLTLSFGHYGHGVIPEFFFATAVRHSDFRHLQTIEKSFHSFLPFLQPALTSTPLSEFQFSYSKFWLSP